MENSMIWKDPDVARKVKYCGSQEKAIEAALGCQGACGYKACTLIAAEVMRLDPERAKASGVVLGEPIWPGCKPEAPVCAHIE